MPKTDHELRTTGFAPLKEDRIHVRCPGCGRKISNGLRHMWDPPRATLVETECAKCVRGGYGSSTYFDADGKELPWDEVLAAQATPGP
jgi:hypothetical protein